MDINTRTSSHLSELIKVNIKVLYQSIGNSFNVEELSYD